MIGRAMHRDREEVVFRSFACDTRECARFGVTQLATFHCSRDLWKFLQRVRYPNLFACRSDVDATLPIKPVRTRLRRAVRPALLAIELRNEHEKAMVGGVEMTSESSDLILEAVY